jgi:hypothetical protein
MWIESMLAAENTALALLAVPYRSLEGHAAPAQAASAIDPHGVLRNLSTWLSRLADSLECHPDAVVSEAIGTLRRGAVSYVPLLTA